MGGVAQSKILNEEATMQNKTESLDIIYIIPSSMQDVNKWITWNYVDKGNKKLDKIPVNERGLSVNPLSQSNWLSFDTAIGRFKNKLCDGLGFTFSDDDDFIFIDLDNCVDSDLNVASWAQEIIDCLDSYTEYSPSMTGFHIYCYGRLPKRGNKKGNLEIYEQYRFATVTGIPYKNKQVEYRYKEIIDLHNFYFPLKEVKNVAQSDSKLEDKEVIDLIRNTKQAHKFDRLYNGFWADEYSSQSEADIAFCRILAFYSENNEEQIARIWYNSGLYRQKLDRRDYRERTIHNSLSDDVYEPGKIQKYRHEEQEREGTQVKSLMTAGDFLQLDIPPREHILSGWLLEQTITFVSAPRGVGKTNFLWGIINAVAKGNDFGHWKGMGYKCLILDSELPDIEIQERAISHNLSWDNVYIKSVTYDEDRKNYPGLLLNEDYRQLIKDLCIKYDIKLLLLDNKSTLSSGVDENSSQEWSAVGDWLLDLRGYGLSILIAAHTGKDESRGTRGHSNVEDALDFVIQLKDKSKNINECKFCYWFTKVRQSVDTESILGRTLHFTQQGDENGEYHWYVINDEETIKDFVKENPTMNQSDMAKELRVSKTKVNQAIKKLKEEQ